MGPWHRWGSELRQYRQAKRLSQQALACVTLIDRSHIGRFERAERPVPRLPSPSTRHSAAPGSWSAPGRRPGTIPARVPLEQRARRRAAGPVLVALGPAPQRPWSRTGKGRQAQARTARTSSSLQPVFMEGSSSCPFLAASFWPPDCSASLRRRCRFRRRPRSRLPTCCLPWSTSPTFAGR
ncbi:helix-turn-helix domain-containing protein [Streptomyces diastaticus]|uniref:helix-turn-helix domain-containing protein n=1 Tax=Streptomyces diastaticus TaxID=1956 RepID=UPI0035DEECC9